MGKRILSFVAIFAAVVLFFQNCGSSVDFSKDTNSSGVAVNGDLASGDQQEDIGVINKACQTLPQNTQVINIRFPKPQITCEWGKNGNLTTQDAYFRARIEQKRSLGLPVGAVICDATFDFNPQPFRYDDYFAILFNKNIITAGYDFRDELSAENFGLLSYDWEKIRGINMNFGSAKEQIFCPQIPGANATCIFPGHDTQGTINLNLDSTYIRAVMSNGVPADHSFTMVTFGDNDEDDCEHSDVEFDITVSYILTQ